MKGLHPPATLQLTVYHNFTFATEGDKMELAKIMEQFEAYCIPKCNVTFERHRFFTSKTYEFGGLTESLIKDRIVCGIPDNGLRERKLRGQDLNLGKAIALCRAAEAVKSQAKELISDGSCNVDAVRKDANKLFKQKSANLKKGMGQTNKNRMGNQKSCSRCKPSSTRHEYDVDEFYVDAVNENKQEKKGWMMTLKVNDIHIPFKLDTGAQVNVMSEIDVKKIRPRPKINGAKVKVPGYSGANIPVKGKCIVKVTQKDKAHTLAFIVVPKHVQAILGLSACERLNLVKRVLVVESKGETDYEELMKEYQDLFQGLGCVPGEHMFRVDKNVPPVIHPCRGGLPV
ncbi:hypothetical protein N1851_018781 [Merluccius polli]|uniref:Peptidase A2 domain-containing protein n=1 Tax=Merluccius polli TaxID=89951 RepID=A0AA47MN29_MERPO|nr:hypothetical protein N1851_018781 [Merluccius polli]